MSVGAAITRGLGGALLALAALALVAAIVAVSLGNSWLNEGHERGDDGQAEAGADLMLGAAVTFGIATASGVLGGFLFFLGSSLLRRYEAQARQSGLPSLPERDG